MLPTDLIEVKDTVVYNIIVLILCDHVNLSTPAGLTAQQIIIANYTTKYKKCT